MKQFGFFVDIQFGLSESIHKAINYSNNKFLDDKVFWETPEYLVILDGVILNRIDLLNKYGMTDWASAVHKMYILNGDDFFIEFRGSFCGVLYDKKKNRVIAYSDHLGTKFLYYYYDKEKQRFICSTLISKLYEALQLDGVKYDLDLASVYLLLSYGFMVGDKTLCNRIRKIPAGSYATIQNSDITIKQFYLLNNDEYEMNEEDAVEIIDNAFRKAVKEEFEKDREYNYKHLVALSGGLDSRMTSWVAHELGYSEQINYTFAQIGSLDQTVPQSIISDLKHEWVFKALDNGLWLYNIEDVTRITGGNVLYYGLSHSYSMYNYFNFDEVGMFHTGQLGDAVIGTHTKDKKEKFSLGDGAYSKTYIDRLKGLDVPDFANKEIGFYYFRCLPGANNGNLSEYCFTEMYSPFYNLDFMETCLKIPAKLRYNHTIYKKWILKKYTHAADYTLTGLGAKIIVPFIEVRGKQVPINKIPSVIYNRLVGNRGLYNRNNMNPIGYYLETNKELKSFLYSYFHYIDAIKDNELRNDLLKLKESSNPFEIIEAISLLAAIKLFYSKN